MNKKMVIGIICIAVIAVALLLGLKTLNSQSNNNLKEIQVNADHKVYENAQELADDVDLIVVGEPINDITEDEAVVKYYNGKNADPSRKSVESFYTLRNIKVNKVLKGTVSDTTMKVGEVAAVVEGTNGKELMLPNDYSVAQKGKKYIFFLKKGYTGDYFIMAVNQGKFNVDGTDSKEALKSQNNNEPQYGKLKNEVLNKYSKDMN